jgi:hypothetical protein
MYVVLVGDSGIPRKTTSVSTAATFVHDILGDHDPIRLIDGRVTAEALEMLMHERTATFGNAQIAMAVPELAAFIGGEAYIANMPALLTDLYDCPTLRHGGGTIARGEVIHKDVWLAFLSASTPIWLLRTVNSRIVEGGFSSRCLFIAANAPKQSIPWPNETDNEYERAVINTLLMNIKRYAAEVGPISILDAALELFKTWYANRLHSVDPYKQSFEAREDAHVLRLAALLCVNDGAWEIRYKHMKAAIECIEQVKNNSGTIFENGIIRTKYAAAFDVVRTTLLNMGMDPISRHVLTRKCRYWIQIEEFNLMLEAMHELGVVQRFVTYPDRGRPTEHIRGTERLLDRGVGEAVLDRFI